MIGATTAQQPGVAALSGILGTLLLAEGQLREAASALPGAEIALQSGHAGREIVDFAEHNMIDCIVMASHKPGLSNLLLGSTADRVVRHARCSVHVIR